MKNNKRVIQILTEEFLQHKITVSFTYLENNKRVDFIPDSVKKEICNQLSDSDSGDFSEEHTGNYSGFWRIVDIPVHLQMDEDLKITCEEGDTIEVWLTKERTPIAYQRKKHELVHLSGMTEEEAEGYIAQSPFVLDIFYSHCQGLFAIESEAIENCDIYNPYSGKHIPNENLL